MNIQNINFNKYFNKWLYDDNGYYATYKAIGKNGDFYTSVSTSSFFGGTIGKKIVGTIKEGNLPKNTTILEIGAHHGYLLADIIQFIYTLNPQLLETLNFAIVEKFDKMKIRFSLYRPFFKQYLYLDKVFNQTPGFGYLAFPENNSENLVMCVPYRASVEFSAIMSDVTPDIQINKNGQCFPLKTKKLTGERERERSAICA